MPTKKKLTKAEKQKARNEELTKVLTRGENLQAMLYQSAAQAFAGEDDELDQLQLTQALRKQSQAIAKGDTETLTALLASQVQSLNAMFAKYGALANANTELQALDTCAKIALRAQSQCRSTCEAISAIQNPPHATFMTQNNISHGAPQQVNNGKREGIEQKQADQITKEINQAEPERINNG